MPHPERIYLAIDLKSFYASVECVERGLDPLTTSLVVADETRTRSTICLAVTPPLKARGVSGRPRLFEVFQRVGGGFIIAPPRMSLYISYSARIYQIYLKYVAPEDIHVYSIDEVFIDATPYLKLLHASPHQMAVDITRDIYRTTGVTATVGIGSNLYLAKVAMDIMAKKMNPDMDGVRVAQLDEMTYRRQLWDHQPLTDFWRVGHGTQRRLAAYGIHTMGDIARASLINEDLLYDLFGVNAELLIDHAWGWESCTIDLVKAYRPVAKSMQSGQVLPRPYPAAQARVVIKEMAQGIALDLLERGLTTDRLVLHVGYDAGNLKDAAISSHYDGEIAIDHYGRKVPQSSRGSMRLADPTFSSRELANTAAALFDRVADPRLLIRRLTLTAAPVSPENAIRGEGEQLELFVDYQRRRRRGEEIEKERGMMLATLNLKRRFGKNIVLRGLDFDEGATTRERNTQIGGHKA